LKGDKNSKFAHNIVSFSPRLENEILVTELIKDLIPDFNNHFYLFNTVKALKMATLTDTMERLDSATKIEPLEKEFLLTYNAKKLVYLDSYLKKLSETNLRKYFCQLIVFYKSLLNSITKLVEIRLIHNNISLDTLIVDEDMELLFLTKFGSTMDIRREKVLQFCSNKENFQENLLPIEFHLLHYQIVNNTSLSLNNIETIIKKYNKSSDQGILSYFNKYINKTSEQIVTDMIKYADTWDNFAASIAFKSILVNLENEKKTDSINKFISQFMKLLETNLSLNPTHRNTIANTLEQFDSIILETDFRC
jgi:hypothetical protein